MAQLEGFVKAAQKVGKGIGSIFKKKQEGAAGSAPISLDDLLQYSNVRSQCMSTGSIT